MQHQNKCCVYLNKGYYERITNFWKFAVKQLNKIKNTALSFCFSRCIIFVLLINPINSYSGSIEYSTDNETLEHLNKLYLSTLADSKVSRIWAEIGYLHLQRNENEKALAAFKQALLIEPSNASFKLQEGYVLQLIGKNQEATEKFLELKNSSNPEISLKANDAYSSTRGLPNQVLPKPYFAEIYLAPEYNSHWHLATSPLQARVGASFGTRTVVEPYISYRDTIDNRTGTAGTYGSQIYNDTVRVIAGGIRLKPDRSTPLSLFIEQGQAYDRANNLARDYSRPDTRGGFMFYKEWGTQLASLESSQSPRFVIDFYADTIYYSRYSGNWISYARFRPGYRIHENDFCATDVYIHTAISHDSRNVIDNRFHELGIGAAYRLYSPLRLNIRLVGMHVQPKVGLPSYDTLKVIIEHESRF